MSEVAGLVVSAALTLFILSYLAGDNPLYRLALYLFIGGLVGYSFGIVLRDVLVEMALSGVLSRSSSAVVPVVLGILLLFKGFPEQGYIGNLSIAYLIGVGTAVALGGALLGTLAPQITAAGRAISPVSLTSFRFGLVDGLMVVVGTVATLLSFTFVRPKRQERQRAWGRILGGVAWVGRVFLVSAFGITFAGALTASLSILIGRTQHLIDVFYQLVGGW
jgi:hypothetical protein